MHCNDCNKHEVFQDIKSEIRGSEKYLIVGIDVGKLSHAAFFCLPNGKVILKRFPFQNSREGFTKIVNKIEAAKARYKPENVVIGVEPTASYHKPLAQFLAGSSFHVVLVAGNAVKKNRELLDNRWDKNDPKDAVNIADLISQGKYLFHEAPSKEIETVRELLSLRKRLKKEDRSLKVRIRNCLLAKYFPELDRVYNRAEKENLAIIRWCFNPEKIASMDFQEFFTMVTTRKTGLAQEQRLRKIYNLAGESVGCRFTASAAIEAEMLVDRILGVKESLKKLETEIESICKKIPGYALLLTIPGFGPYVSAVVLSRIGNPFRFKKQSQVIKLSGYDLGALRSGKNARSKVPSISKRGNGELRYALYQAAVSASTHDNIFLSYYTKLLKQRKAEKGIEVKMRVKIAAKMLVIAWTMLKKNQNFNPDMINI
ncbi:Transposase, IS116/IS110/IS902 family [Desulfonema limicola]|uniref:Transposase, IS116/IS110/IS902 family n=1 Tax=Desulfonema limicola TaxID=45656 RepID=A0A975B307_9BACT|nr:IS110 family transposase [Desulfonema limicola]QTA77814.1 Transposase, IS116/IS110/IS902 family [Desulfonema limicola]QTA77823.1 Transposase, IS116/IS110/IS902 family [Desulfonema limicola]QTA77836.1 Transposase, IS116/IS110/IS902 family [Desulfonema limicola]QTA77853.1 Transposase, IS116/IS110/IS902 family [Desulfonema limicola]QTA82963.1 Transposase, IS116/IS110/IS902 family [Desulfonema limicola]